MKINSKEDFLCKICGKIRKEPIFLPCKCASVCKEHTILKQQQDTTVECVECRQVFDLNKKLDFKENKLKRTLIENGAYLTQDELNFKKEIEELFHKMGNILDKLDTRISNFAVTQFDHFEQIRREIDIKRETILQQIVSECENDTTKINKTSIEMIRDVERFEAEFKRNFEQEIKPHLSIINIDKEKAFLVEFFREPNLNLDSLSILKSKYEQKFNDLHKRLLNFNLYEYDLKRNRFILEENEEDILSLGRLVLNEKFVKFEHIQNIAIADFNVINVHNLNTSSIVKKFKGHTKEIECIALCEHKK